MEIFRNKSVHTAPSVDKSFDFPSFCFLPFSSLWQWASTGLISLVKEVSFKEGCRGLSYREGSRSSKDAWEAAGEKQKEIFILVGPISGAVD